MPQLLQNAASSGSECWQLGQIIGGYFVESKKRIIDQLSLDIYQLSFGLWSCDFSLLA
jgi:hypothetical protein